MALLKYTDGETVYAECDGKLFGVRYKDCCGKNQKPFIKFGLNYDFTYNEFEEIVNKTIWCTAWGRVAEIINWLSGQNRLQVKVSGKIEESEWQGEKRENLVCTWVEPLFQVPSEKSVKKKPTNTDWDEAESEFGDY